MGVWDDERPFDYPGSDMTLIEDEDFEIDSNETDEDFWHEYFTKCFRGSHEWDSGERKFCITCGFAQDIGDLVFRHSDYTGVAWRVFGKCHEHFHCQLAHMVGDDRTWHMDLSDLVPIDNEDYCSGCGQIGCTHG